MSLESWFITKNIKSRMEESDVLCFFFLFVPDPEQRSLTKVVERSLLSLLFIPLLALVFLLVWKVSWPLTPDNKLIETSWAAAQMIWLVSVKFYCRAISLCSIEFMTVGAGLSTFCRWCRKCVLVWVVLISAENENFGIKKDFLHRNRSDHEGTRRIFNRILEKVDSSQEQKGLHLH